VTDPKVIREWCKKIDYGRILPLLAVHGKTIIADASLHQTLGAGSGTLPDQRGGAP